MAGIKHDFGYNEKSLLKHNAPKRKELLCDDTETKYFHLKEDRRGLDYVRNIKSRKH